MKSTKKIIIPVIISVVLLGVLAAVLILSDKTVKNPIVAPEYETHYLTAAEETEFYNLLEEYDHLNVQYCTLSNLKSQKDELLGKKNLSDDDKAILECLPMQIKKQEKKLENQPSLEEIDEKMDSLGTTNPIDGVEYTMKRDVEVKAAPHNYCRAIAQSDFSADCTN